MKKRIVLCADDYGQAPAISEAIINLLKEGRLTATSCMVNTDYWPLHATWLAAFHQQADIGLHFNLTAGKPLSTEYRRMHGETFRSLPAVMGLSLMHSFSQAAIEAELHAQLDQFQEAMGFLPDHVDGHQHIHQFPVIREAVIGVYEQRLLEKNTYIRWINLPLSIGDCIRDIKKIVIYAMGAKATGKLLAEHRIPHNASFSGIAAFSQSKRYPLFFKKFLKSIGEGGLIMCHPGLKAPQDEDSIAEARFAEYQYLAGAQFVEDCEASGVTLQRFA